MISPIATSANPISVRGLFPDEFPFPQPRALVVGLPADFKLADLLFRARSVWLATAFAQASGWRLIERSVLATSACVHLVTGLDFCQTQPSLLSKWLRLSRHSGTNAAIQPRLAKPGVVFHPKVLLVESSSTFAIVGSANLSRGGFGTNVECSLYTEDSLHVSNLLDWFQIICSDTHPSRLTGEAIRLYRPRYELARKHEKRVRAEARAAQDAIQKQNAISSWRRDQAARAARGYFHSADSKESRKKRVDAVSTIKRALVYPTFNFDENGLKEFLGVGEMGRIRRAYQKGLLRDRAKLSRALKFLFNDPSQIPARLPELLDENGKYQIRGVGLNFVSKILTAHDPEMWPSFNKAVLRTLRTFGYDGAKGVSNANAYLRFADEMRHFMRQYGKLDFLALDAFFRFYDKKL